MKDNALRILVRKQRTWRFVGALAILAAVVLSVYGANHSAETLGWTTVFFWSCVIVLIALALFLALLDVRFIRLRHALEERNLFQETLGTPEFQEAMRKAREQRQEDQAR